MRKGELNKMPLVWVPGQKKKSRKRTKSSKKRKTSMQKSVSDDNSAIKKEIAELKAKRERVLAAARKDMEGKKGFKKFGTKLGYSKQVIDINNTIKQREQYLNNKFRLKSGKQQLEMNAMRKQLQTETAIKPISSNDIFGDFA